MKVLRMRKFVHFWLLTASVRRSVRAEDECGEPTCVTELPDSDSLTWGPSLSSYWCTHLCSWLTEQDTSERSDGTGAERELCGRATRREGWAGRADSQLPGLWPALYRTAAAAARSACAAACVWSALGASTRRASTRMKSASQASSTVAVYVVTKLPEPCEGWARITRHHCRVSGVSACRAATYDLSLTRSLLSGRSVGR